MSEKRKPDKPPRRADGQRRFPNTFGEIANADFDADDWPDLPKKKGRAGGPWVIRNDRDGGSTPFK